MADHITPIIDRFGGIRPAARALGVAVNTIQWWKRTGRLPAARVDDIEKAAAAHGIAVSRAEIVAAVLGDAA